MMIPSPQRTPRNPVPGPGVESGGVLLAPTRLLALTPSQGAVWFWCAFGGFLAGTLVAQVLLQVVAQLTGHGGQVNRIASEAVWPAWYVTSSLVGLWMGMLGGCLVAVRLTRTGPWRTAFGVAFKPVDLVGLLIGVAAQYGITAAYLSLLGNSTNLNGPSNRLTGGFTGSAVWIVVALTVVGSPVVEELFFRGLLVRSLGSLSLGRLPKGRLIGVCIAGTVLLDGLAFGAAHGEALQLVGLAVFGAILAGCYLATGRITMGLFAHIGFNAVALASVVETTLRWH